MKIAQTFKNGDVTDEWLLLLNKTEARLLVDCITKYCESNKRDRKAKLLAKMLADNLCCY